MLISFCFVESDLNAAYPYLSYIQRAVVRHTECLQSSTETAECRFRELEGTAAAVDGSITLQILTVTVGDVNNLFFLWRWFLFQAMTLVSDSVPLA